jgi:alcohol dehydrogenase (NADP+)
MSTEQIPEKFSGWLGHEPEAAKGKMVWGEFEPKVCSINSLMLSTMH